MIDPSIVFQSLGGLVNRVRSNSHKRFSRACVPARIEQSSFFSRNECCNERNKSAIAVWLDHECKSAPDNDQRRHYKSVSVYSHQGSRGSDRHHSSLFLLLFCAGHPLGCAIELVDQVADEELGEADQLLWLDLVIVVLVNRAEQGVDILVRDWHANVVTSEEVGQELAKLASVQVRVVVVVVLLEILHDFFSELSLVIVELLKLVEGSLEFSFSEVRWVDHYSINFRSLNLSKQNKVIKIKNLSMTSLLQKHRMH